MSGTGSTTGQFADFLHDVESFQTPIVMGIWPLVSLRNAEFLANEVPGVKIPEHVMERMRRAQESGNEAALAEGITIARETLATFRGSIQGAQISAPFGRIERALEVLVAD